MNFYEQLEQAKQALLKAAQDGNVIICQALLNSLAQHCSIAEITDEKYGGNILHWSASHGHLELVQVIVENYPELLDKTSENGSTALLNAIVNNHEQVVRFLLKTNANAAIRNAAQKNAFSGAEQSTLAIKTLLKEHQKKLNQQFIFASQNLTIKEVETSLINGACIETPLHSNNEQYHYTVLFWACSTGQKALVSLLLQYKADVNVVAGKNGFTPLHAAVFFGHEEIVKILLQANASETCQDADGKTPLELAKIRKLPEICRLFKTSDLKVSSAIKPNIIPAIQELNLKVNQDDLLARFNQLKTSSTSPTFFVATPPNPNQKAISVQTINTALSELEAHFVAIEKTTLECVNKTQVFNDEEIQEDINQIKKNILDLQNFFSDKDCPIQIKICQVNRKISSLLSSLTSFAINLENEFELKKALIIGANVINHGEWTKNMRAFCSIAKSVLEAVNNIYNKQLELAIDGPEVYQPLSLNLQST
ncbi:ankyrin repeat domain-containing protein [Legionella sp. 16cNR16C]|uniref:ankyrin repeat domain-containing protein n=1 Tax=Legionella sp. 16cNR16C TaxID=2905656 RepID=UPI001E588A40|nr:ankyrin repeat domain-containing protein [Legionella sp. 16cNR16C]MCE3043790.1 ankyrin repeat domain-containing protein [Legionella sp. 16cNR16C]